MRAALFLAAGAAAGVCAACAKFRLNKAVFRAFLERPGPRPGALAALYELASLAAAFVFLAACVRTNIYLFAGAACGLALCPLMLAIRGVRPRTPPADR
ncbi:MAG: hypothetical protein LBC72_04970 [Spirochaetaceae bacterium]|jgi:hypothetical protein|nr:hypothetical protein [Spirochaetaceae bacterium]